MEDPYKLFQYYTLNIYDDFNMSRLDIDNFRDYLEKWICSNSRTLDLVWEETNKLDIMYHLNDEKVYRDDARGMVTFARFLKVLMPVPFIAGLDHLKEDASCILSVEVISVYNNIIKLNYDISVCNGSSIDKNRIRKAELKRISNRLSFIDGFTIQSSTLNICIDKCVLCDGKNITKIDKISFARNKCIIEY